jgi:selenocysteine-specific elongation factor
VPPQAVEEILKLGVESGDIVRLPDDIFYTPAQIETVQAKIQELFGSQSFTAADFRDKVQTSRKYAIPLLEFLDSVRFTLRLGDKRVISRPEEAQPQK